MVSVEVGFDKINNPIVTILCCSVQWRNNVIINYLLYLRVVLWTMDIIIIRIMRARLRNLSFPFRSITTLFIFLF